MSLRKVVSLLCTLILILTILPQETLAAEITAIDLSENQTRFTEVGEEGTLIVYGLSGAETERERGEMIDNSSLSFSSSNTAVAKVDDNGNYSITGEGIAIITVTYGSITGSMVYYVEDAGNLFTVDESINTSRKTWVERADDSFRNKSGVLKIKDMLNPKLTDTTYAMGGWFYDSTDTSDSSLWYKFGPRAATGERPIWGAYLPTWGYLTASVMGISNYVNTVAVKKDSRIKGWHQFFTVIQRVDSTTHYMTFFDGELVLKGTTSSEIPPYFIDQMTTLCQEVYIAPYSLADFDIASINISDGEESVSVNTGVEIVFNRSLGEGSELSAVLTDTVNNQEIELETEVKGNSVTLKPIYPLANNTGYELTITGSAVSKEDMFNPSASVNMDKTISFTTEKADIYAENLKITHTDFINFSADIINSAEAADVWLIAAQYDGGGIQKQLTVKKTANAKTGAANPIKNAPADENAELSEGYVWTGLDALEAKSLAAPASTDIYTRALSESGAQTVTYADVGYSPDSGIVEVHGYSSSKRAGLPVLIRVIKPNKDFAAVTESNVNDIYARAEQISTAIGGRFDYKFELESEPGLYKVIVNIPFSPAIEDEINFASKDDVYTYMGYVQNPKTHPETTDPAEVFKKARLVLDMNYTAFDALTNKSIVYAMMDKAEDFDTFKDFSAFFAEAVEAVAALETNDGDVIEEKKTLWGIGNLSVYAKYKEMSQSQKADVHRAMLSAGFNDYKTLSNIFAESIILKELKAVDNYSEIYPILEDASDCFENEAIALDFAGYEKLTVAEKGSAMRTLSEELSKISSKADIITAFNKAVSKAYEENNSGAGVSGKASYSGGFSGGSGGGKTEVIKGTFETETEKVMGFQTPEWVEYEKELSQRKVFDDIDSVPWAEDAIRELYNRGIITGKSERIFAPNDYLTREELAKILIGAMNLYTEASTPCNLWDVNRDAWYAPYADIAVAEGIIQGSGDGSFGVGLTVNREEICTIADRAAQSGGIYLDDEFTIRPFLDEAQISSWALYSVNKMRESFVVSGVGGNYFDPKTPVTRAQAAKIIYGVLAYAEA